jgi:hypothetical protein
VSRHCKALTVLVLVVSLGAACSWGEPSGESVRDDADKQQATPEVALRQDNLAGLQTALAKRVNSAPAAAMKQCGLAGALGGAHVRVTSTDPQEIRLPIPQLADGQVPLCYAINSDPADAATEFRLRRDDDGQVALVVRLAGKKQDVQLSWSSVVLLTGRDVAPNRTPADPYRKATACVQAQADEITKLAAATWPGTGKTDEFAANIRRHITQMRRAERPRSLDAVGILKSGENTICTANANLATALMRSKGIACRTVAVIPCLPQRFEMHRIAEFFEKDRWVAFDPSLQTDIPVKPWQYVIMARTTARDEERAMKPRPGSMLGCPYGQEIELLTSGVSLSGQDFFWTQARPLAEFEATEETARRAAEAWQHYLETGTLTPGQVKAASATTAAGLADALSKK